jgi:peroxiredoxin family protein
MQDVKNLKKSKQLSMACGIMGMQVPVQTCEIILDLMDIIRDKGDDVTIGDVNRVLEAVQEKVRQEQAMQQLAAQSKIQLLK